MPAIQRYILMPILNRQASFFRSSVLDLSDRARIQTIDDSHFGSILDQAPDRYRYLITPKTKCVYVRLEDGADAASTLRDVSVLVRFAMNFLADEGPFLFSFGMLAEKKKKLRILRLFEIPAGTERQDLDKIRFRIGTPKTATDVKSYYTILEQALLRKPSLLIALNRINWFMTKDDFEDRIIDLTIGLESLIPGKDELRYRFALYLSFITTADPGERQSMFELFRALYDTRSRIVHGGEMDNSAQKVEQKVRDGLERVNRSALSAISYYVYFLATQTGRDWSQHVQGLVLTNEPRIVD